MKKLTIILLLLLFGLQYICNAQSSFSSDRIESAIVSYLKNEANEDIEVEILQKIRTAIFEESGISASFSHNFQSFKGIGKITIHFKSSNRCIRSEDVRVKINKFKTLPVASKMLNSGKVIEHSDIIWQRVDVTNYDINNIIKTNILIGKKLKNGITKGSPFLSNWMEGEALIKRGQNVEIVAQSGAVMIRAIGTALQDGSVGELIRVKREGYGNTVMQGEVAPNGSVILNSYRISR